MKESKVINYILRFCLIVGVFLMLYPVISEYYNSFHQSKAILNYNETIANLETNKYEEMWNAARSYNNLLLDVKDKYHLSEEEYKKYESILNVDGTGIMGFIEIPLLQCELPIYHGTEESVLQIAIGHLEWTSFPVGGESTHCVVSGHRGLPSAKLFTNLNKMVEGDIFLLHVLDETLTYEVDQILIVEPHELDALQIEAGQDLCTLITCTPFGINSHRLLVRGHRIENLAGDVKVNADAMEIDSVLVATVIAVPVLVLMFIVVIMKSSRKGRQ